MDEHGYPEENELEKIKSWDNKDDFHKLMEYIKSLWKYADCGYWKETEDDNEIIYTLSTGGWSGNEDISWAMQNNRIFWMFCWYQSTRGGTSIFKVKKDANI